MAVMLNGRYRPVQEEALLQAPGQMLQHSAQGAIQYQIRLPCAHTLAESMV
jgi:hypothetical protein